MSPTTITFYSPDSSYSTATPTTYHLREISYQLSSGELPARLGGQLEHQHVVVVDDPGARDAG